MKPERVQLSRQKGSRMPPGTVVVARPTKWGNPFTVERFGLARSIELFRATANGGWSPSSVVDLDDRTALAAYELTMAWQKRVGFHVSEHIRSELRGKNLACWCPLDQPCHADVLLELANAP